MYICSKNKNLCVKIENNQSWNVTNYNLLKYFIWVQSLDAVYQVTCSFFWSHEKLSTTFFFHICTQ